MADGANANVKMGVQGLSQFKQSMNQAKQAVKTLDAQLSLTEKQFKQSGDAESYMTEKAALLQAKLAQQSQVVESAQKALDDMTSRGIERSSKAYQEMYRQMITAKAGMIDTQTAIDGIGTAADDTDVAVDGLTTDLSKIGQNVSVSNVSAALDKITDGMEAVIKKAWEVGKAITNQVLGAGNWADDLATRAKQYGISTEELQQWDKTAKIIDTTTESIMNAKRKMERGIENNTIADSLDLLGLGNIVNNQDPMQTFWDIGKKLMGWGDEISREAMATEIFGKSWTELLPLFEEGQEKVEALNESWSVVDDEHLKKLTEMQDTYDKLNSELETVKMTFLSELAPAATTVMETLTSLVGEFNKYLQTENGQKMMESLSAAVTSLFDDLKNIDPEDVMNTVSGVLNKITESLEWIRNNKDSVVTAVKAFIAAWGLLETAKGVSIALQLFTGLKNLGGSPTIPTGTPTTGTGTGTGGATVAATGSGMGGFLATMVAGGYMAYKGAEAMGEYRRANPDRLVGSEENFAARAGNEDLQDALVEYLMAEKEATENPMDEAAVDRLVAAEEAFHSMEGWEAEWRAYADWLQTNTAQLYDLPATLQDNFDKMNRAAEEINGAADKLTGPNSNVEAKITPADIAALATAISNALAGTGVYMDTTQVGQMVAPTVGGVLGWLEMNE